MSLVAVAALAASLLLARSWDDDEGEGVVRLRLVSAGDGQPDRLQLDAIRAAGL